MGERSVDFCFFYYPHPYETHPEAQLGLGLLSIASYAEKLGASVRVINAQADSISEALLKIPKCHTLMLYGCLVDTPVLKQIESIGTSYADRIMIGGPIAKTYEDGSSIIVDGYGEDCIEGDLEPGLRIVRKLEHDFEYYPFPNRRLIEGSFGGNIFKQSKCRKSTTILTSRGCFFKCAFCESGNNGKVHLYSIDRISKELASCLSLGIKNIRISDDNLMINKERLYNICGLLKEGQFRWRASVRVKPTSLDDYKIMKESGCQELSFGVESGDQQVLNMLNKRTTVAENTAAIKNAKKAGIFTRALLMMGTPGESYITLYKNIEWVKNAQPDMVSLKMFVPYPGTMIYSNPRKFLCKINIQDTNNSAYRPDDTVATPNIKSDLMTSVALYNNFHAMRQFLEQSSRENRG